MSGFPYFSFSRVTWMLRFGSTRTVLLTKHYAFKFPTFNSWKLFLHGLLGNMQEKQFSTMRIPELAPVLFTLPLGLLVVMPRVDVKSFDDEDRFIYLDAFNEAIAKSEHQEILTSIVEQKIDSIGMLGGKVVAVDFGS